MAWAVYLKGQKKPERSKDWDRINISNSSKHAFLEKKIKTKEIKACGRKLFRIIPLPDKIITQGSIRYVTRAIFPFNRIEKVIWEE